MILSLSVFLSFYICVIIDKKSNCRHNHVDYIYLDYAALTTHPIVSVVFDNKYYFSVTNL